MRLLLLVATSASLASPMYTQNGGDRPTIAIQLVIPTGAAPDSAALFAAVREGLTTDSLLDFVERPARRASDGRPAVSVLIVSVIAIGNQVRATFRAQSVETAKVLFQETVTVPRAGLAASAREAARRAAHAIVGRSPGPRSAAPSAGQDRR